MNPRRKTLAIFLAGSVCGAALMLLLLASAGRLSTWRLDRSSATGPVARTAPAAASHPSPTPDPLVSVLLLDFATGWTRISAGPTHLDGELWVPEIKTVVKNTGTDEIQHVWLKAMFIDNKGIITSEQSELVEQLPPGYARGPIFLTGRTGYPGTSTFVQLRSVTQQWRYELYQATTNIGPWTKIGVGLVDLPSDPRPMARR